MGGGRGTRESPVFLGAATETSNTKVARHAPQTIVSCRNARVEWRTKAHQGLASDETHGACSPTSFRAHSPALIRPPIQSIPAHWLALQPFLSGHLRVRHGYLGPLAHYPRGSWHVHGAGPFLLPPPHICSVRYAPLHCPIHLGPNPPLQRSRAICF